MSAPELPTLGKSAPKSSPPASLREALRAGKDWKTVRLDELVVPHAGAWGEDKPGIDTTEVTVLGVGNVTNDGMLDLTNAPRRYLRPKDMDAVARVGDLLVVKSSGSAANIRSGKTAICPAALDGVIACSNFMMRLSVRRHLAEPYLLWLLLNSQMAKRFIRTIAGSSTYPNIKWDTLRSFSLRLPENMADQRRIAAALKEQLAEVERALSAVEEQIEAAERLPRNCISTCLSRGSWPRVPLGDVVRIVAMQVDPKLPAHGALPHVSAENIESGTGTLLPLRSASDDGMTSGKYLFGAGDLLYSKLRPYLRKAALVDFRGLCSADMYPLRPDRARLLPEYALWQLLSDEFTAYAEDESRRARMPKLNRDQLFAWRCPIPPLNVQHDVANLISNQLEQSKALLSRLNSRMAEIEHLPAALLRQAFGENVNS